MKARVITYTKSFYKTGSILILATVTANVLNFLFSAFSSRVLGLEMFGILSLLGSILSLADILYTSLSKTVTYKSAYVLGKYNKSVKKFWKRTRLHALFTSLIVTIIWILCIPFMTHFFDTDTPLPLIIITPIWTIGTILAVDSGYLSGNLKFVFLSVVVVIEALAKLVFAILFVSLHNSMLIYASIPLSMFVAFLFAWVFVARIKHTMRASAQSGLLSFPMRFFATSLFIKTSSVAYLSFDLILAKHYLTSYQAGQYALISLCGKMIFFAGSLFTQFVVPLVSNAEGAGKNSRKIFNGLLLATLGISLVSFLFIGVFGFFVIPFLLGARATHIVSYLPLYTFGMVLFTIANSIASYYQVKHKHLFPIVSLSVAVFEIAGIMFSHASVNAIVLVMVITGLLSFVTMFLLHVFYSKVVILLKNFVDFIGLFLPIPVMHTKNEQSLRILIFNWRDTSHIWSGGAEVYIHELAKSWVEGGNIVMQFCGNDGKHPRYEIKDGIQIVRRGGFYTVYLWAFLYYIIRFRSRFDIVIDSANGIPFFTPLYSRVPVFLLIHHIHQEVFRDHLSFPLSLIARFVEQRIMPLVYFSNKIVTVSDSSKADIERIGLGKRSDIFIIRPGVHNTSFTQHKKTPYPSLFYLGRLKPYKKVDTIIKAFVAVAKKYPTSKLFIVGDGESREELELLVQKLRMRTKIKFLGNVSEVEKQRILGKCWIMVQPSQIEGWGITVIEANASKTPVIASNVAGLRDSVVNGRTGLLVQMGNVKGFSDTIDLLFSRPFYRRMLTKEAYLWSKKFSWKQSSEEFLYFLQEHVQEEKEIRRTRRPVFLTTKHYEN